MSVESPPVKPKRVFPMHLTPFENYMLLDDRKDYPMTFIVQFELTGRLRREPFESALKSAMKRHPLLHSIIRPAKQNRDCWVGGKDCQVNLDWADSNTPIQFEDSEFIDLRNELGLRIWVRCDDSKASIVAQFHHAVTDGIGSYQFFGDLFYFYAKEIGLPPDGELPEINPSNLRQRLKTTFPSEKFVDEKGNFRFEWGETARMLMQPIIRLKPKRRDTNGSAHTTFPGTRSHIFEKDAYRQLRLKAQEFGQTPNDFLLEKLFVTLRDWNHHQGKSLIPGKYCVLIPLDLRDQNTPDFPAANIVTYSFVRRSGRTIADHQKLVDSLRVETTLLKNNRHGTRFMNMIAGSFYYERTMKMILRGKCLATAVMSNTGDPTRHFHVAFPKIKNALQIGDLQLESVSGVPPMRKNTRVTISAFTYRRVLHICLRCDPKFFTDADTQEFLNCYVDHLSR